MLLQPEIFLSAKQHTAHLLPACLIPECGEINSRLQSRDHARKVLLLVTSISMLRKSGELTCHAHACKVVGQKGNHLHYQQQKNGLGCKDHLHSKPVQFQDPALVTSIQEARNSTFYFVNYL